MTNYKTVKRNYSSTDTANKFHISLLVLLSEHFGDSTPWMLYNTSTVCKPQKWYKIHVIRPIKLLPKTVNTDEWDAILRVWSKNIAVVSHSSLQQRENILTPFALLGARDKNAAPELKNKFVGTQPNPTRHIARLHRLGRPKFYWNFKHTQITVAITGGATILRVWYKTMLRAERAEFFWFIPQLVTFWGHISRKSQTLVLNFIWI